MAVSTYKIVNKDKFANIDEIQMIAMLDIIRNRNVVLYRFLKKVYDTIEPDNTYK